MLSEWKTRGLRSYLVVSMKLGLSFLLFYHVIISLSVLALLTDFSLPFRLLYLLSLFLALYGLFGIFLRGNSGIAVAFFYFLIAGSLNSIIGVETYSFIGLALAVFLWLFGRSEDGR